jgi:hypothetical protein
MIKRDYTIHCKTCNCRSYVEWHLQKHSSTVMYTRLQAMMCDLRAPRYDSGTQADPPPWLPPSPILLHDHPLSLISLRSKLPWLHRLLTSCDNMPHGSTTSPGLAGGSCTSPLRFHTQDFFTDTAGTALLGCGVPKPAAVKS